MAKNWLLITIAGLLAMTIAPVQADNLTGADKFLCTAVQATVCDTTGDCEVGVPWLWNIPQFVVIDLEKKTLGTTRASGENRVTPINTLMQEDGLIVLQGVEGGRAFSFVIQEQTGNLSVAVAREELTVSVFGACTPQL